MYQGSKEQDLKYILSHLSEYDEVDIVSYTPSFLLDKDVPVKFRSEYAEALWKRLATEGTKTRIFLSASGLRKISSFGNGQTKNHLEQLKKLEMIQSTYKDRLEVRVLEDNTMPSMSLILAHVPQRLWKSAPPYDLWVEYYFGITPEKLFAMGEKEEESSMWETRTELANCPDAIRWVLDKIEASKPAALENWVESSGIKFLTPSPNLAILSAMPDEIQYYRKEIVKNLKEDKNGGFSGHIKWKNGIRQVIMPSTTYGRNETGLAVTRIHHNFPEVKEFIGVGIAGGSSSVEIGDIVISEEIVDVFYERIQKKHTSTERSRPEHVFTLSSDSEVVLRTKNYDNQSGMLYESANMLRDKAKQDESWWGGFVGKYLQKNKEKAEEHVKKSHKAKEWLDRLESTQEWTDRITARLPAIHVSKIWSSDHNVNDIELRDKLHTTFGVNAFEMEGGGLAAASTIFGNDFIEIRAISDMADGRRENDDAIQPLAFAMASACLEAFLSVRSTIDRVS